jgi:5-hydroxyisourate hydrolase
VGAVTTHVLDVARGRPAAGVRVRLDRVGGPSDERLVGRGETDADGRLRTLTPGAAASTPLEPGQYRLTFDTGAYFAALGQAAFYPTVQVTFAVEDPDADYHVPLLLAPFGYSTYRGS